VISARRPDIAVINKLDNTVELIDVSIPADRHIVSKENENNNDKNEVYLIDIAIPGDSRLSQKAVKKQTK